MQHSLLLQIYLIKNTVFSDRWNTEQSSKVSKEESINSVSTRLKYHFAMASLTSGNIDLTGILRLD